MAEFYLHPHTEQELDTEQELVEKFPKRKKQRKHAKRGRKYRLWPLVVAGVLFSFLFAAICVLGYSIYCYFSVKNGNVSVIAPTLIYLCSIAVGSFVVSFIIRGSSFKPAFVIALLFFIVSMIYSFLEFDLEKIKWTMIPMKFLISMVAAVLGFLLSYLPNLFGGKKRKRSSRQRNLVH